MEKKFIAEKAILVSIKLLKPHPRNSNLHSPQQIDEIAASIAEFGFTKPILITKDYFIIAGHGAVEAAKQLKYEKVPCLVMSHLSERQIRAYIIADNKIARNSSFNMEIVSEEINYLAMENFDLSSIGFNQQELDEILSAPIIIPEEKTEIKVLSPLSAREVVPVNTHVRNKKKAKTFKCPHCGEMIEIEVNE